MWKTPAGERKLQGRERVLFVESVLTLQDLLRDSQETDDDYELDVPVFDRIPLEHRGYVLLAVAESLLGDALPPPIRGWNAGTIGAVYAHVEAMVEIEVDNADHEEETSGNTWRRLVHDAWMERCFPQIDTSFDPGEGDKQSVDSRDLDHWAFKIEGLLGEILEDDDYNVEDLLDIAPERAAKAKDFLGIEKDYFTEPPPVFSPGDCERLTSFRQTLLDEERRSGGRQPV